MASFRELKRRSILPLIVAGLAAYYLVVLRPMTQRSRALDAPLENSWRALATSLGETNGTGIDFQRITNQLHQTRRSLEILETARAEAAQRLELAPDVRARMAAPFQLVDYENERSRKLESLRQLARQQKVTVDPPVFASFPERTADLRQPSLLWPALALIENLLTSAIQAKVTAIHSLDVPLALFAPGRSAPGPVEIPLDIDVSGTTGTVVDLIRGLPLRGEELKSAGLAEAATNKPALFVDRLVIRKQTPEKPDEIRASIRVVGFVFLE